MPVKEATEEVSDLVPGRGGVTDVAVGEAVDLEALECQLTVCSDDRSVGGVVAPSRDVGVMLAVVDLDDRAGTVVHQEQEAYPVSRICIPPAVQLAGRVIVQADLGNERGQVEAKGEVDIEDEPLATGQTEAQPVVQLQVCRRRVCGAVGVTVLPPGEQVGPGQSTAHQGLGANNAGFLARDDVAAAADGVCELNTKRGAVGGEDHVPGFFGRGQAEARVEATQLIVVVLKDHSAGDRGELSQVLVVQAGTNVDALT